MPLCKRHRARVEPAVDDLGDSLHLSAAVRTFYCHRVNERAVQLDIVRAVFGHFLELRDRAHNMALAAGAFPDV